MALQAAVYAQLVPAMAGQGADGGDVPVYDHIPVNPPRYQLRLDEFSFRPGDDKRAGRWRHRFAVHVFTAEVEGRSEAGRLHGRVLAALRNWQPLSRATPLTLLEGYSAAADAARAVHEIIRFQTIIGEF